MLHIANIQGKKRAGQKPGPSIRLLDPNNVALLCRPRKAVRTVERPKVGPRLSIVRSNCRMCAAVRKYYVEHVLTIGALAGFVLHVARLIIAVRAAHVLTLAARLGNVRLARALGVNPLG